MHVGEPGPPSLGLVLQQIKPVHSSRKKHKLDFVIDGRVYDATTHDEEKEQTFHVAARQIGEVKANF